jgi:two-component system, NtrC family, response regulator AtoC
VAAPSPANARILVADDDPEMRERVGGILGRAGYNVTTVSGAAAALASLGSRDQDAVLLDLDLSPAEILNLFKSLRRRAPGVPVLVIVPPDGHQVAVQVLRAGAEDYLLRPPDPFELKTRLARILERRDLGSRIAQLQEEIAKKSGFEDPVGRSAAMRGMLERVARVAPMRATVLIFGESGVGKELVARAIHFNSPRREGPFIAVNCAAMPANLIESELFGHEKGSFTGAHARTRGKFELAHRGSLFLDEIGEMDLQTQAKLLRVLEEREFMRVGGDASIRVDVRVVAATNADLETMIARGRFRRDLYYRLKVVTLHVPPLRDRRSDIPILVETFLDDLSRANAVRRKSVSPGALEALQRYHWPGNVRELKNIIESMLVSAPGDIIRLEDLPPSIVREGTRPERPEMPLGTTLADMEREMVRRTLEHTGGNRTHSAALLGIGVRTLQRKIQAYGLEIAPKRRRPRRRSPFPEPTR